MSEIIYGIHSVKALLDNDPQRFLEVFILKGRDDRRLQPLIAELEAAGLVIQVASTTSLEHIYNFRYFEHLLLQRSRPTK